MLRQAGRALGARARPFTAQPCIAHEASASPVQRNLAAVLYGIKDLRFEEHPLPSTVQPGSMRIRMKAVGICGSDVHYLQEVGTVAFNTHYTNVHVLIALQVAGYTSKMTVKGKAILSS